MEIINKIKRFIFVLSFALFLLPFSSATKAGVDGSYQIVVPNGGNLISGCIYSAEIRINSGSNSSNAADVIVQFNPTLIEIIDSDPLNAGKQIKRGTAYEIYPITGNIVDENTGTIKLVGVSLGSSFSGSGVFGNILFRSRPGAVNASFTIKFDGVGATLDSNIAETSTSTDILASKTDANMTFISGECVDDNLVNLDQSNISQNVVQKDNSTSGCSVSNDSYVASDLPWSNQVNSLQKLIANNVPGILKPMTMEVGFLGLASIIALLTLPLQAIISLISLILGGFFLPFLTALIIPSGEKKAFVIDDFSKEGIVFVKITVFEKLTGRIVRKAYTDLTGKFAMKLDPGVYIFKFEKSFYKTAQFEVIIDQTKQIDFVFELSQLDERDLSSIFLFRIFNLDPKIISVSFAFILSLVNLLYMRSSLAVAIFLIVLLITFYIIIKQFSKKKVVYKKDF